MIPKINFIWSFIYQESIHSYFLKKEKFDFVSYSNYVEKFIKSVKKKWEKNGNEILKYCEEITNLKWNKNEISCYVIKTSPFLPISDPLTIPIQLVYEKKVSILSKEKFIDMLIHELIHNLFMQNTKKLEKYFNYLINEKYNKESFNTAIHIPLHAIHKKIFLKFFNKNRFNSEIQIAKNYKDYKKSWEIVNKEGEEKILKEMKSYSKSGKVVRK